MMANCRLASSGPSTVGHNWPVFHSSAGPALAVRDGAVMSASTGPAPGRRGMLTGPARGGSTEFCRLRPEELIAGLAFMGRPARGFGDVRSPSGVRGKAPEAHRFSCTIFKQLVLLRFRGKQLQKYPSLAQEGFR